jgi:hypothetical protein
MTARYRVESDGDGHYYLIPADKQSEFFAWMDSKDFELGVEPDWAKRIDGPHRLTFTDPREE